MMQTKIGPVVDPLSLRAAPTRVTLGALDCIGDVRDALLAAQLDGDRAAAAGLLRKAARRAVRIAADLDRHACPSGTS